MSKFFVRRKSLKQISYTLIGFLCLATFVVFYRRPPKPNQPIILSESIKPLEAVAALGQLSPVGETRLLAAPSLRTGGIPRISSLLVEEGDYVSAGEVLAIFDNQSGIYADLNISRSRLETIQNNIVYQKRQVERYQKAASQGATPLSYLDREKDKLNQLIGKEKELKSEINRYQVDLRNSNLLSPINGIVLKINYREGERPGNDGVLQVASNQSMEALIEVYESDISRVSLGQKVTLTSENGGFEGELKGLVSKISPKIQQRKVLSTDPTGDADARIVNVRVTLDSSSSAKVTYFTGMKVIARFHP